MNARSERLVWIDCEMTGLDLEVDEIVEVAVVITDYDLNPVDAGFQIVIKPSKAARNNMGEFVTNMHTTSGLITELDDGVTLAEAEKAVVEYISRFVPEAGKAPLAGNTIGTDRSFIVKDLPAIDAYLHYRSVDVSSIKELARRWYPRAYFNAPKKDGGHRALADILESIRELAYYRSAVFVPEPGPTSDEAKSASDAVVNIFASKM
ncbi:MAG: oligoribonuclease [Mycetocola sp.]